MSIMIPVTVFLPIVFAVISRLFKSDGTKLRDVFFVFSTATETILVGILYYLQTKGTVLFSLEYFASFGLRFEADGFRALYCCIAAFLWLMTSVFTSEYLGKDKNKKRYVFFNLLTFSGVLGVFLSADLFTAFVFFEIMSFASYPLVIHEETAEAMKAGETYLGVSVISGMILLVGIFFVQAEAKTLVFEELRSYFASNGVSAFGFSGGILILLGFGAKAGIYPLHIWLPQAHPVAPSPASALLSGILTKTGVFGIIVISANVFVGNGTFANILLCLAVVTMFFGAFLALFSNNLKRTLACSSMSQIGFILVGVAFTVLLGKEGGIAENGALMHMMNHSLIKLVLFMCAGVVAMNIHTLDLNGIRGYGRKKPFLAAVFAAGALGIAGMPLFNGYISKTMLHESITEYISVAGLSSSATAVYTLTEWIFLISGGITVAYMTKLFVCIFIEKNKDEEKQKAYDENKKYLSPLSKAVFGISAAVLPVIGLFPQTVIKNVTLQNYDFFGVGKLEETVDFFGLEALKGGAISIAIGVALYFLLVRTVIIRNGVYRDLLPKKLDLEKLVYRPVIVNGTALFVKYVVTPVSRFFEWLLTKGTFLFVKYAVTPVSYFFEHFIIYGTLWFTLTVVRFVTLLFDKIIVFLCKTVLKPHVYRFREETVSMKVGEMLDTVISHRRDHKYAERMDSFADIFGQAVSEEYSSFSFAYAMISLGIIIVLLFAVFG